MSGLPIRRVGELYNSREILLPERTVKPRVCS
uniref:Uncharacterized protein n=1 Tax=Anguilla anguilla TaxID=7936 RepID=A0A0E9VLK4_ANGAN